MEPTGYLEVISDTFKVKIFCTFENYVHKVYIHCKIINLFFLLAYCDTFKHLTDGNLCEYFLESSLICYLSHLLFISLLIPKLQTISMRSNVRE
jgi:hypothetical protein